MGDENLHVDTTLKPCPFCGTYRLNVYMHTWPVKEWRVMCEKCLARGPGALDQEQAEDKWNKRESSQSPT